MYNGQEFTQIVGPQTNVLVKQFLLTRHKKALVLGWPRNPETAGIHNQKITRRPGRYLSRGRFTL